MNEDWIWQNHPERKIRISELAERIKPIVSFPFYVPDVDPVMTAYMWNARPVREAKDLVVLCEITTYHRWGWYGFFKPSVAEVLAQIPEEMLDKVVAFEIVDYPRSIYDLNKKNHKEALYHGYHIATTRLYGKLQGEGNVVQKIQSFGWRLATQCRKVAGELFRRIQVRDVKRD